MAHAIQLARKGLHSTSPNPRVGCVIVKDDVVIGEGFHIQAGSAHAEVCALNHCQSLGNDPLNSTAYVTLEPCSHTGRTGPCAIVLKNAGISRVVVGHLDPNPKVAGNGIKILQNAGIVVEYPCLELDAKSLNVGYIERMLHNMPRVTAKIASSLDGRTAMASGESKWITGDAARHDVQSLRAQSCAIITGIGTVLDDNPSLMVRDSRFYIEGSQEYRQPLHVIVDSNLRIDVNCTIVNQTGQSLVVFAADPELHTDTLAALHLAGVETLHCPNTKGKVDLKALLQALAKRECNEVMIEAGARLTGVFLQERLIDQLIYYIAPTLLGSNGRPQVELPLEKMSQQIKLNIEETRQVGQDIRITATPCYTQVEA
ncbi:MAG: bifunctional diaminohydroxyphosphoribosylaminopyrimidine deaminase/5-amino-6-(5-phosphoribosylamino)uracil reductase RibD [Sinobacterium sp.]|nr:bifunctional diaminohydroxyphosphoribosylaminopyrimidine deaminase/5-amino-6-(5-phosphoribosylamino)uracil reductase RibD [Sinobacterium sp.]